MRRILLTKYRDLKKAFSGYTPHIQVLVSKSALIHNLNQYRKTYPNVNFAPVLKSNAYGHGLLQVAEIIDKQNVPFIAVDSLYEAKTLREGGIKSEILVIGYVSAGNIQHSTVTKTAFAITSLEQLRQLAAGLKKPVTIQIKFDTGMHRQGLMPDEISQSIKVIKSNKHIKLQGIMTHFADADSKNKQFTESQIQVWNKIVKKFKAEFPNLKYVHSGASAGSEYSAKTQDNVARLGIGLYGINPSEIAKLDLQPVLKMQSVISSLRDIKKGESVGYNHTFTAKKKMKVATVPVGYFEGIDRRLSNNGSYLVDGIVCPILGRVSMNITSIDVSAISNPQLGQSVTVISDKKADGNSVENIAKITQTIPYEVLTRISQHLRRSVVD